MGSAEMKNILFDQYQRYKNAAQIINENREGIEETFRILEVGANEHQNLEHFLPKDDIKYLDIQLPEELLNNPKYILGDATEMNFEDGAFDVVVALDVFEHIPPDRRNKFIGELFRVCSKGVILTAPFHSAEVVAAEDRVNVVYKTFFGQDFIWLQEHRQNGLPILAELEQFLKDQSYTYKIVGHGNIDIWERIMTVHFVAATNPLLGDYRQKIDYYYNDKLFSKDYSDNTYRKVVIISKDRKMNFEIVNESFISEFDMQDLAHLETTFFRMAELLKEHVDPARELDVTMINDRIQVFLDFGNGFSEEDSHILQVPATDLFSHFSLNIEGNRIVKAIRIDPSDHVGAFKIDNLMIFSTQNLQMGSTADLIGDCSNLLEGVFVFEHDDPSLTINFDTAFCLQSIEFDILYISKDYRLLIHQFLNCIKKLRQELSVQMLEAFNEKNRLIENNRSEIKKYQIECETYGMEIEKYKIDLEENQKEILAYKIELEETNRQNEIQFRNLKIELEKKIQDYGTQIEFWKSEYEKIENSRIWKLFMFFKKFFGG